jgi:hypothetical protein
MRGTIPERERAPSLAPRRVSFEDFSAWGEGWGALPLI